MRGKTQCSKLNKIWWTLKKVNAYCEANTWNCREKIWLFATGCDLLNFKMQNPDALVLISYKGFELFNLLSWNTKATQAFDNQFSASLNCLPFSVYLLIWPKGYGKYFIILEPGQRCQNWLFDIRKVCPLAGPRNQFPKWVSSQGIRL